MQRSQMHPFAVAVIFSFLLMGLIGIGAVVPIAVLHWLWNSLIAVNTSLPPIQIWQTCLLYTALATFGYLMGWVKVEVRTKEVW